MFWENKIITLWNSFQILMNIWIINRISHLTSYDFDVLSLIDQYNRYKLKKLNLLNRNHNDEMKKLIYLNIYY